MEENKIFGMRLRELRKKAGMSLRELALRVNVDFTYLSKIENGVLPPPSERVIRQLAETLNADKDELLALAGKIPADIAEILKDHKTVERLRAERAKKEAADTSKRIISIPRISIPKVLYRLALPIFLVIAVGLSLWYAAPTPVRALEVTYPSLPPSGNLGSTYTFTVKVNIQASELLPLQQVDIKIYKADDPTTYKATLQNLPKQTSSLSSQTIAEGSASGTATVSATADSTWTWFHGTGYAYWKGTGYSFTPATGYGYGYQTGIGSTSITYTINWSPPSNWIVGSYRIDTILTATSETFTETSSTVTLAAAVVPSGGGTAPVGAPGITSLTGEVTSQGEFINAVTATSDDNKVRIDIAKGAIGTTSIGHALSQITIIPMPNPPDPPTQTSRIGLTYNLGPNGAQFPDGITLTLTYDPATVVGGTLVISYWDGAKWVDLNGPFQMNATNHTITTTIYHFTPFSVLEHTSPAAFTASALAISPAQVNTGEKVSISITIANTGDLKGTHDVVLKINNAVAETKQVTLTGHTSQVVTFSTTQTVAGIYAVNADGVSGTFTVKTPAPPPAPTPTPTPAPTPATPPAPPVTPPTPPAPPVTPPAPVTPTTNWALIGGIIAAVIIIAVIVWLVVARRRAG